MQPSRRSALGFAAGAAVAASAAMWLRPTRSLAAEREAIDLERQIPANFSQWKILPSHGVVVPNPEVQASLDALYSQTLARTYINDSGDQVMLSIAYGSDQSSEATAVHRPEFCYAAQGFAVKPVGYRDIQFGHKQLRVMSLLTSLGSRIEPVIYWITIDDIATLPGVQRKLMQLRYGLRGSIPDGMLFRVSSLVRDFDARASYLPQERFLADLYAHMAPRLQLRYFGR